MRKELNLKILENKNCANGDGNKRTEESDTQAFQLGTWKNSNNIIKGVGVDNNIINSVLTC